MCEECLYRGFFNGVCRCLDKATVRQTQIFVFTKITSGAVGISARLPAGLDIGEPGNASMVIFLAVPLPRLFRRPMNPLLPVGVPDVGVARTLGGPLHAEKSPVSDSAVLPVDGRRA